MMMMMMMMMMVVMMMTTSNDDGNGRSMSRGRPRFRRNSQTPSDRTDADAGVRSLYDTLEERCAAWRGVCLCIIFAGTREHRRFSALRHRCRACAPLVGGDFLEVARAQARELNERRELG